MTRQDVLATLRDLISGRRQAAPLAWQVEDGLDGGLTIEADGDSFDVDVRSRAEGHAALDDIFGEMTEAERCALARSLDEAVEEAERDGPVPAEELRRSLDEAKARGLKEWNARHGIAD